MTSFQTESKETLPGIADLGCIIMASGMGKRFGSNKLLTDFHGKPLFSYALTATDGMFSRRIVVTRHPEIAEHCKKEGCDVYLHTLPYRNHTIRIGIGEMEGMEGCVFCPADQPLLRKETVKKLTSMAAQNPACIWRTSHQGQPGAPVYFPKWTFEELKALPQEEGGGFLIRKYPDRVRYVSVPDRYELMDIDTPEDLSILLEH